jgi:hypothetical protein
MLSLALYAAVITSHKAPPADLAGAWTTKVQFTNGAFSAVKDLEFMMVFIKDGTMLESSNYDASPPVPPAYGIWRKTGSNKYEAKYFYYITKPPAKFEEISGGGGWMPDGKGEILERITLAPGGKTYKSTLTLKIYDAKGKLSLTWNGVCNGVRMKF